MSVAKSNFLWGPLTVHMKMDSVSEATQDNNVLLGLTRSFSLPSSSHSLESFDATEDLGHAV